MPQPTKRNQSRVLGLDSIRFIAAGWVMLYHIGTAPLYEQLDRSHIAGKLLGAGIDCIFNGPAAVIVFFVISGFCIHYPFRNQDKSLHIPSFLFRRYIRILVPLLACLWCTKSMGLSTDTVGRLVGWSIECELIYYTIYPIILPLGRKFGWGKMVLLFFPLSIFYIWKTNPSAMMYPSFGLWGNAFIGLPCWLLGVKLAEYTPKVWKPSSRKLFFSRIFILIASSFCFSMMLHLKIGFPWSLNFFAILTFFWLSQEVLHFQAQSPWKILEWGGKWSYSLYLMHGPIHELFANSDWGISGIWPQWWAKLICILLFSYIFYLLVEKPSHFLARYLGNFISKKLK